jgi:AcrR family transcriptional regulator
MPKRTAAHTAAMRERILEGGRRAFIGGGYRGTTVPTIAAEAGVSVGLIYRYFPSKEELFLELCLSGTAAELQALAERIRTITDPVERLRVAVESSFEALFDAIGAPLVLQALSAAPADQRVRAALVRRGTDLRAFSAAFIRDAMARGEVEAGVDVEDIALVAATLLDGALVAVAEQGDALDRAALRETIVRAVAAVAGLRPATASRTPDRPHRSAPAHEPWRR